MSFLNHIAVKFISLMIIFREMKLTKSRLLGEISINSKKKNLILSPYEKKHPQQPGGATDDLLCFCLANILLLPFYTVMV